MNSQDTINTIDTIQCTVQDTNSSSQSQSQSQWNVPLHCDRIMKNILTLDQINFLNSYFFNITKIPKTKEKKQIALDIELSPFLVNKWFQAKRNKEKRSLMSKKYSLKFQSHRLLNDTTINSQTQTHVS